MKKFLSIALVLGIIFLTSCSPKESETDNSEKVKDLIQNDQEKADSMKRALGIE